MGGFIASLCGSLSMGCGGGEESGALPDAGNGDMVDAAPIVPPTCEVPQPGRTCLRYRDLRECAAQGDCPVNPSLGLRLVSNLKINGESIDFDTPPRVLEFIPGDPERAIFVIDNILSELAITDGGVFETRTVVLPFSIRSQQGTVHPTEPYLVLAAKDDIDGCGERATWHVLDIGNGDSFGQEIHRFEAGRSGFWSRDGTYFINVQPRACDDDSTAALSLWQGDDITSLQERASVTFADPESHIDGIDSQGDTVIFAIEDSVNTRLSWLRLSDLANMENLAEGDITSMALDDVRSVDSIALGPDEAWAVVSDSKDDTVYTIDLAHAQMAATRAIVPDIPADEYNLRLYQEDSIVRIGQPLLLAVQGQTFMLLPLRDSGALAHYRLGADGTLALGGITPVGVGSQWQRGSRDIGAVAVRTVAASVETGQILLFNAEMSVSLLSMADAECLEQGDTVAVAEAAAANTRPICAPERDNYLQVKGQIGGIDVDFRAPAVCQRQVSYPFVDGEFDWTQPRFDRIEITGGFPVDDGWRRGRLRLYAYLPEGRSNWDNFAAGAILPVAPQSSESDLNRARVRWIWQTQDGRIYDEVAQQGRLDVTELSGERNEKGMIPGLEGWVGFRIQAQWSETETLDIEALAPCKANNIDPDN